MASQADRIRRFLLDNYIASARARGAAEVVIRAGDVHQAMGLTSAMPAVCSAIGSHKFVEMAGVASQERTGPSNGANAYFRCRLGARRPSEPASVLRAKPLRPARYVARTTGDLDLRNAVVLVSCVKSKLARAAPARKLYTSAWFSMVRDLVGASGARWFILSALYGLVAPDQVIAPYDHTLNNLGVAERRAWASEALKKLLPAISEERRVMMFAGQRYREFLVEPLVRHGLEVEVPMANLRQGEQLAWLSDHR